MCAIVLTVSKRISIMLKKPTDTDTVETIQESINQHDLLDKLRGLQSSAAPSHGGWMRGWKQNKLCRLISEPSSSPVIACQEWNDSSCDFLSFYMTYKTLNHGGQCYFPFLSSWNKLVFSEGAGKLVSLLHRLLSHKSCLFTVLLVAPISLGCKSLGVIRSLYCPDKAVCFSCDQEFWNHCELTPHKWFLVRCHRLFARFNPQLIQVIFIKQSQL